MNTLGNMDDKDFDLLIVNAIENPDKYFGALVFAAYYNPSEPRLMVAILRLKDCSVYNNYREYIVSAIARVLPSFFCYVRTPDGLKEILTHIESAESAKYIEHWSYSSDEQKLDALHAIAKVWGHTFYENFKLNNTGSQVKVAYFFKHAATIPVEDFEYLANYALQNVERNSDKSRLPKMRLSQTQRDLLDALISMKKLLAV